MKFNLKKYKLAKILSEDLPRVVAHLSDIENSLKQYIRYKPVANVAREIRANKAVLEAHLQEAEAIVKAKGEEVER